ncbi:hypothetical protein KI387_010125, partial [Taxus chinensis]
EFLYKLFLVHQCVTFLKKSSLYTYTVGALFSASNPSRTASEHLERGTCLNFNGGIPNPISSIPPSKTVMSTGTSQNRKRSVLSVSAPLMPLSMIGAPHPSSELVRYGSPTPLVLSGGKEDLGALAMLEDSVKKLKSP